MNQPNNEQPLSAEQVAEILARAEAATKGPWERGNIIACQCGESSRCWHQFDVQSDVYPPLGESGPVATCSEKEYANGTFFAAARTDVPDLCRSIEAVRAALRTLYVEGSTAAEQDAAGELLKQFAGVTGEAAQAVPRG